MSVNGADRVEEPLDGFGVADLWMFSLELAVHSALVFLTKINRAIRMLREAGKAEANAPHSALGAYLLGEVP